MANMDDLQEDESLKIYEEEEDEREDIQDNEDQKEIDNCNGDEAISPDCEHVTDGSQSDSAPDSIMDYGAEHCDSTTVSVDKTDGKASSEPLIDYAKNTMNSFLSMYGYEESVTTETIKSKIKSEPPSPQQQHQESIGEKLAYLGEVSTSTAGGKKAEEIKKDLVSSSPRTATVLPLQSTAKPKMENGLNSALSSGPQGNGGATPSGTPLPAPRKPVTPYMRYRNMIFEEIKHKFPGCSPYDLACLISSKWSMLTDSERKVWEDQYEQEVREYSVHLKEYSDSLKNVYKNDPPAAATAAVSKMGSPEETKTAVRRGSCNWCKKQAVLLDFSSVLDGREIYCTGLCSDKCFTEAAKQIVTIENGSTKPRYISGSRSQSSSREDVRVPSFAAPASHFPPPPSATTPAEGPGVAPPAPPPPPFQVFDWDRYLAETRSSAAPWLYFKQSRYPPSNNFVVGMKLEACNGQTMIGYSLATVVAVSGARILLHFDGSDASSDIWRLPDSGDIHPVGWTEASQLKPPTGYKYDTTKYRRFHASSLQNAEIAPARLFKKEPRAPIENYFIAGMKLEAVLKQNPAVIGVASIRDTDEERIRIEFDGCKGTGYWTHYTDRDLFPAGWCSRSGHPLKPPGNVDTKAYMAAVAAQGSCSPSMVSSTSGESRSSSGSPYVIYPPQQSSTITSAPPLQKESSSSTWKEKNGNNNVEIFINTDCYCGPYLDPRRVERMQHVYRGSIVTVLKSVLEETIRCAIDSKTVFGFLKPGRGNCIVTAQCDGMTYQCCLNSIDRVSTFWRVLEQFSDNLRCCPNLFSSVDYRHTCNRCHRSKNSNVSSELGSHHASGKSSSSNGFSSNGGRRPESKLNENLKTMRQQENHFELSSSTGYDRECSRDEHETLIQPRHDYHSESLRQDPGIRHHEISRQESSRQDSIPHETLRHTLHQEALASTSRSDSLSQDSVRADMSRSEALQLNSSYETMRQESYSSEGSKDDVFHAREDSKEELFHNNQSPPTDSNRKHDLDRENAPVDVTVSSPPEKKKRLEKNEVSGVEILTAPKTWTIAQVIEFIERTDLKDNVDKFRDNEIDGKALLLLKRDLVLSHMGFKLGPAVKLLDVIDELRAVQEKFL